MSPTTRLDIAINSGLDLHKVNVLIGVGAFLFTMDKVFQEVSTFRSTFDSSLLQDFNLGRFSYFFIVEAQDFLSCAIWIITLRAHVIGSTAHLIQELIPDSFLHLVVSFDTLCESFNFDFFPVDLVF